MQYKHLQPVADTLVSTNKSPTVSTIQNDTKVSTYFPVPQQLITNKIETITWRQVQDKNREQPFYPDPFFRHPPRPLDNLQLEHQKLTQLLNQR